MNENMFVGILIGFIVGVFGQVIFALWRESRRISNELDKQISMMAERCGRRHKHEDTEPVYTLPEETIVQRQQKD